MEGPKFNFHSSIDAGPEEMQKQKAIINNEGREGNAAVLIGSGEELPILHERLESEGIAKDLASYIALHKKVLVNHEKIPTDVSEQLVPGMSFWFGKYGYVFVDKDRNIACVNVDLMKIADKEQGRAIHRDSNSEFEKLGFAFIDDSNIETTMFKLISTEEREAADKAEIEKKSSFSF